MNKLDTTSFALTVLDHGYNLFPASMEGGYRPFGAMFNPALLPTEKLVDGGVIFVPDKNWYIAKAGTDLSALQNENTSLYPINSDGMVDFDSQFPHTVLWQIVVVRPPQTMSPISTLRKAMDDWSVSKDIPHGTASRETETHFATGTPARNISSSLVDALKALINDYGTFGVEQSCIVYRMTTAPVYNMTEASIAFGWDHRGKVTFKTADMLVVVHIDVPTMPRTRCGRASMLIDGNPVIFGTSTIDCERQISRIAELHNEGRSYYDLAEKPGAYISHLTDMGKTFSLFVYTDTGITVLYSPGDETYNGSGVDRCIDRSGYSANVRDVKQEYVLARVRKLPYDISPDIRRASRWHA